MTGQNMLMSSRKQIRGLNTYTNPLLSANGQCIIADNTVVDKEGCIGNRRGFDYYSSTAFTGLASSMHEYQSSIVLRTKDDKLYYDNDLDGTFTQYSGTYIPPTGNTMRGTNASGNFYFSTNNGTYKISGVTNTPLRAGAPYALDTQIEFNGTGGGFVNGSCKVGYQVCWTRTDANNLVLRSAPSYMVVLANSSRQNTTLTFSGSTVTATTPVAHGYTTGDTITISGATQTQYNGNYTITVSSPTVFTYTIAGSPTSPATGTPVTEKKVNVSVSFSVPADVVVGDSYEIYRTPLTVDQNTDPGNVAQLTYSAKYVSGTQITYVDTTPDSGLQAFLYSNPTQEGLTQYNFRPPNCTDIEFFQDYTFYTNTSIDHFYLNTVISNSWVTGTSSITINNGAGTKTYTAAVAENIGARQFRVYTASTLAVNIRFTCQSLVRVINQDATSPIYAEYISGQTDVPGKLRFYARTPNTGSFWVTVNNSTTSAFFLTEIPTSGIAQISSNDAAINRVFYSKFQQPDSVPLTNYMDIGRKDKAILRTVALRDSIFFIKEDGIFYTGNPSSVLPLTFFVRTLDPTCFCAAPNSVAKLNNKIYMLTNQGFTQVSENAGVGILSTEITDDLKQILAFDTTTQENIFASALDFDRHYVCWTPTLSTDTYGTQAFVYHADRKEWTKWTKPATCGLVLDNTRTFYIGSSLENKILYQRNSATKINDFYNDYSDEETSVTITAVSPTTVTFTYSSVLPNPTTGMSIHQAPLIAKFLSVVNNGGGSFTATIDRPIQFAVGAASVRQGIASSIQMFPDPCGEAGIMKIFQTISFSLNYNSVSQATMLLGTNQYGNLYTSLTQRAINLGWGVSAFGNVLWGDTAPPIYSIPWRMDVPLGSNTGETMSVGWQHNVSGENYYINYADITFVMGSEITTR